ncbi:glyoxylate/hydroxypyruvate reductase A [Roseivirga sp. UBA838]|uniref:2-hydroxyacid dehydrogenase n=1 Tax=Roseivirga sp. UBA838 TaxID=1947393 RepID=UPI00257B96D3|nr:glyoxylate/hydroxypyruvate reductase A [Roseivirga sp. UBA838]|tara:strand:+ start:5097 stop:6032 length:936 start_codon:yes stop_codon:yes gene_type:complete
MDQQKIDVLLSIKVWDPKPWVEGLSQSTYINQVHLWPTEADLSQVSGLFVWKPLDEGVVQKLPNLKWVSSLGAGVDHLVNDQQIPSDIPVTRIVDPFLTRDMTNYCIMGVLMHQRSMQAHWQNQQKAIWNRLSYSSLKVGVLGLGELGGHCASTLAQLGFEVLGYSRTPKQLPGVQCFNGSELKQFLAPLDVLINLLPVTPHTVDILNLDLFEQLKEGAFLINVARGNHLVENDLLLALDSGRLSGALLDVFREEPLPSGHPFWKHPKIRITPHVASVTTPQSAMQLVLENTKRLIEGRDLLHKVNREAGY